MTRPDPFANAAPVADEAQAAPAEEQKPSVGTVHVDVKPRFPEGFPQTEGKIVLTFKGGTGFDAPWIVVHATSLDDALDTVSDEGLADLMGRVQRAGAAFAGQAPASSGNSNGGRPLQQGQPAGSVEAPPWAPPKPYDDFVYVTKVSPKTGRPWHAWMAPNKGDTRDPLFFNAPK